MSTPGEVNCPNCGRPGAASDRFCGWCGARIATRNPRRAGWPEPKAPWWQPIPDPVGDKADQLPAGLNEGLTSVLVVAGIVVAVGLLGVLVLLVTTRNTHAAPDSTRAAASIQARVDDEQHPAAADVSLGRCGAAPGEPGQHAGGEIVNHSARVGNYLVKVSFDDPLGPRLAQGTDLRNGVAPGQSVTWDAVADHDLTGHPFTCKVDQVERLSP